MMASLGLQANTAKPADQLQKYGSYALQEPIQPPNHVSCPSIERKTSPASEVIALSQKLSDT